MGAYRWSCTGGLDRSQGIQKHESINHHEQIQQIIKNNKTKVVTRGKHKIMKLLHIILNVSGFQVQLFHPFSEHIDYSPNESI